MHATSPTALAKQQVVTARSAGSGRSAVTVYGGREHDLRQTLIALTAGTVLGEHESPGEATLQVMEGAWSCVPTATSGRAPLATTW